MIRENIKIMIRENIKIILLCITLLISVYIYTQNTGFNACYKQHAKLYTKDDFQKYDYDEKAAFTCGFRGSTE